MQANTSVDQVWTAAQGRTSLRLLIPLDNFGCNAETGPEMANDDIRPNVRQFHFNSSHALYCVPSSDIGPICSWATSLAKNNTTSTAGRDGVYHTITIL